MKLPVVGHEAADLAAHRLTGAAIEDAHVRAAPVARAGDQVGIAIAVDVAGRHEDAAGKLPVVGVEARQRPFNRLPLGIEDAHVRAATGTRAGNDVISNISPSTSATATRTPPVNGSLKA